MIELIVTGEPITQGSKTAVMPKGASRPVVIEAGGERRRKHTEWRRAVAEEARTWSKAHGSPPLLTGPLVVRCTFALPRPQRPGNAWPIGARSGDVDKLARACLDSMTGVLFADDSQVVRLQSSKVFGDPPGVVIAVWTWTEFEQARRARQSERTGV